MQLVSQTALIAACRAEANMEGSEFISDAQIGLWLTDAARSLYNLLLRHKGQSYYARRTAPPLAVSAGAAEVSLPSDFYQLLGVRHRPVGGTAGAQDRKLVQCDAADFAAFGAGGQGSPTHYNLRGMFAIDGATTATEIIELFPTPNAAGLLVVDYVPSFRVVSAGAVSYDGVNGWEQWMVYDVAARMLHKEGNDVGFCLAQRARVEEDVRALSSRRDRQPAAMIDVKGDDPVACPWWRY